MTNALNIIRYIFGKFITLLFDDFTLFTNVSIGWIMVTFFIIAIMITNILSLAKSGTAIKHEKENQWDSDKTNWRNEW